MPRYKKQTITQEYSIMIVLFQLKHKGWYKREGKIDWKDLPPHLKKDYSKENIITIKI